MARPYHDPVTERDLKRQNAELRDQLRNAARPPEPVDPGPTWVFCQSSISAERVGDLNTIKTASFRDERHGMNAAIRIDDRNLGRLEVLVSFVHASRRNRAIADAARLLAMILDTYEDLLLDADREPETVLEIERPEIVGGTSVRVIGADALAALYGFFGDAIEEVM